MPVVVYSLDNAIQTFFERGGASSSRQECDDFVRQQNYTGDIEPVGIQGSSSYTVVVGDHDGKGKKIVQFRENEALLDVAQLKLAKEIHGSLVPACKQLGWVGEKKTNSYPLTVYEMECLPGENYVMVRSSLVLDQQYNTIRTLASFFADAWKRGSNSTLFQDTQTAYDLSAIANECSARFDYLSKTLPERFQPVVEQVRDVLPQFFDGSYPLVLTHSDLNEMNILVDPTSGSVTGVVDWPDAQILPFGFSLYALGNALGNMVPDGWKWFEQATALRGAFWEAFRAETGLMGHQKELVELAEKGGILVRYGTAYNSGFSGMIGVLDPEDGDFRYLDGLLF